MIPVNEFEILKAQLGGPGTAGGLQSLIPLVLILGVFYFLLIRPQQLQAKAHQKFISELKRGDKVVSSSGLYGRIVDVSEVDLVLEVAPNTTVRFQRDKIGAFQP